MWLMAAGKRALVIGAGAIGLLLVGGAALASTKPNGGGGGPEEDPHSPEACDAYKKERASVQGSCNALQAQIYDYDAQRIEAYQNGNPALGAQLDAAVAGLKQQLASCKATVSQLDNLIAGCA